MPENVSGLPGVAVGTDEPDSAPQVRQGEARGAYGVERHDYVSTACQHDKHGQCRTVCKFCPAKCRCACHLPKVAARLLPPEPSDGACVIVRSLKPRQPLMALYRRSGNFWQRDGVGEPRLWPELCAADEEGKPVEVVPVEVGR